MGPRMREDTKGGRDGDEIPRGTRNDIWFKRRGWVPACARTRRGAVMATRFLEGLGMTFGSRGGDGSLHPRGQGRGRLSPPSWPSPLKGEGRVEGGSRTAPTEGRPEGASRCRRDSWLPSWRECPGSPPAARWRRSALRREQRRRVSIRRRPLTPAGAGEGWRPGRRRRQPRR